MCDELARAATLFVFETSESLVDKQGWFDRPTPVDRKFNGFVHDHATHILNCPFESVERRQIVCFATMHGRQTALAYKKRTIRESFLASGASPVSTCSRIESTTSR
ncbi:MAG: hypothetical protein EBQ54_09390, partial [Actinobacteria bacterium]|nr:hypothetical protein [Actinomycetota bacterium]